MPQMAPISWLTLFILFTFIYLLFLMLNYFNYFINCPTNKFLNNNNNPNSKYSMNWKW